MVGSFVTSNGGFYGEYTAGSLLRLFGVLREHGLGEDAVFLDVGSGAGQPCMLAAACGVAAAVGVEIDPNTVGVARTRLKHVLRSTPREAFPVAFAEADLQDLPNFLPATHVYTFDAAFPLKEVKAVVKAFNGTGTAQVLVSSRHDLGKLGIHADVRGRIHMAMAGSGESRPLWVYARRSAAKAPRPNGPSAVATLVRSARAVRSDAMSTSRDEPIICARPDLPALERQVDAWLESTSRRSSFGSQDAVSVASEPELVPEAMKWSELWVELREKGWQWKPASGRAELVWVWQFRPPAEGGEPHPWLTPAEICARYPPRGGLSQTLAVDVSTDAVSPGAQMVVLADASLRTGPWDVRTATAGRGGRGGKSSTGKAAKAGWRRLEAWAAKAKAKSDGEAKVARVQHDERRTTNAQKRASVPPSRAGWCKRRRVQEPRAKHIQWQQIWLPLKAEGWQWKPATGERALMWQWLFRAPGGEWQSCVRALRDYAPPGDVMVDMRSQHALCEETLVSVCSEWLDELLGGKLEQLRRECERPAGEVLAGVALAS